MAFEVGELLPIGNIKENDDMKDNSYAIIKLNTVDRIIQSMDKDLPLCAIDRSGLFDREKEMKFQQTRHRWLIWAINNNDDCVKERIRRLKSKSKEYEGYEYLPKYNMPEEIMEIYFFIEDMEIALGIHPAIKGGL